MAGSRSLAQTTEIQAHWKQSVFMFVIHISHFAAILVIIFINRCLNSSSESPIFIRLSLKEGHFASKEVVPNIQYLHTVSRTTLKTALGHDVTPLVPVDIIDINTRLDQRS